MIPTIGLLGSSRLAMASEVEAHPDRKWPVSKILLPSDTGLKVSKIETFVRDQRIGMVKVTADDGSVGWGQMSAYNADIAATVMHRQIANAVLGRDPAHLDELSDQAVYGNLKYPWSYICRAFSGVETALWDLLGKQLGKPVVELLGGTARPYPIYGSSMSRQITPEEEGKRFVKLRDEKGVKAFKFRIAKEWGRDVDAWEGRTEEIVPTVRKAVGDDVVLYCDANSGLSVKRAIKVAKEYLEPANILQFEEPCPYWEWEQAAAVTAATSVPVSGGEQDNNIPNWRRLMEAHAFDIVQPDINYLGGMTRSLRVAQIAADHKLVVTPHSANRAMITVFTLHMMGAIQGAGPFLEFSIESQPWTDEIFDPVLKIQDGKVPIPDQPGWGVQIREDWLAKANYGVSE